MADERGWKVGDPATCRGFRVKLVRREGDGRWLVMGVDGGEAFPVVDESELSPWERGRVRTLVLELDDLDYDLIQREIADRQRRSRAICPDAPTILPDGDSNLAGSILAECVRDLDDYRALWDREHPREAS